MSQAFKRFIVTGAAGFIGSNLCDALLADGHSVIGIDNQSTGHIGNLSVAFDYSKFDFFETDLVEQKATAELFQHIGDLGRVDCIFHLAAHGSVTRSFINPIRSVENNLMSALNVFHAVRLANCKKIVFSSSSSIYGGGRGRTFSPYAIGKKMVEDYLIDMGQQYGIETICLRYFNVFGKRQRPDAEYPAVIPLWISQLQKNEPITINGSGRTSRDFTPVENVVLANQLAFAADTDAAFKTFDVGLGKETSIADLAAFLVKCLNKPMGLIRFGDPRPGDVEFSKAHLADTIRFLKYNPVVDFETALRNLL